MKKRIRYTTLLEVVKAVQDQAQSDQEVVATLTHLLNNGQVTFLPPPRHRDIAPLAA